MYETNFYSMRKMFDYFICNYNRKSSDFIQDQTDYLFTTKIDGFFIWIYSVLDSHIVFSILQVLSTKIVMMNFTIAMLMTVYNVMLAKGDFTYKSNRYEYIERYQIALSDGWGYSELVTTPAPLNIILILILPWVLNPPSFKNVAGLVSKMFFWFENIGYIILFFIYCLLLQPIIYVKFIISLYKNLPVYKFVPQLLAL